MARLNVLDYEQAARETLPAGLFDFIAGGALAETTLANNVAAYCDYKLQYRVLRGIDGIELTTELLGHTLSMPLILAPTGSQALVHPEGELAVRRAACDAGTLMTMATTSTFQMAEVAAAADGPVWFQLYLFKDEGLNREILARVEAQGFGAIALTVDAPRFGIRERDSRNAYVLPAGLTYENLPGAGETGGQDVADFMNANWKQDLSWADVGKLRQQTALPILLKGIAHPEDAAIALEHDIDGIWVSNHGGRQLDGAAGTAALLPGIAQRIARQVPIIVDGGVRRGTDILKALALGATAVAIGRPMLWGLAVEGQNGVRNIIEILRAELSNSMMLSGCASCSDVKPELIFAADG